MKQYKLSMLSELAAGSVNRIIAAETDEEAIRKAEEESDSVPRLICMNLTDEAGKLVKQWGGNHQPNDNGTDHPLMLFS